MRVFVGHQIDQSCVTILHTLTDLVDVLGGVLLVDDTVQQLDPALQLFLRCIRYFQLLMWFWYQLETHLSDEQSNMFLLEVLPKTQSLLCPVSVAMTAEDADDHDASVVDVAGRFSTEPWRLKDFSEHRKSNAF